MSNKTVVLLSSIFLCVWCGITTAAVNDNSIGTVIAVRGQVIAKSEKGRIRTLKSRSKFYLLEKIETKGKGSRAQLKLNDGTIVSMGPNTRYVVSEVKLNPKPKKNHCVGNLLEGEVTVKTGQDNSSHLLKTPVTIIIPSGTLYKSKVVLMLLPSVVGPVPHIVVVTAALEGDIIVSGGDRGDVKLDSRDPNNNACFCEVEGVLNEDRIFKKNPETNVRVYTTSNAKLDLILANANKKNSVKSEILSPPAKRGITSKTPPTPAVEPSITRTRETTERAREVIRTLTTTPDDGSVGPADIDLEDKSTEIVPSIPLPPPATIPIDSGDESGEIVPSIPPPVAPIDSGDKSSGEKVL